MNRPPDKFSLIRRGDSLQYVQSHELIDWSEIEDYVIALTRLDFDKGFCIICFLAINGIGGRKIYEWDRARPMFWVPLREGAHQRFQAYIANPRDYRNFLERVVSEAEWHEQTA